MMNEKKQKTKHAIQSSIISVGNARLIFLTKGRPWGHATLANIPGATILVMLFGTLLITYMCTVSVSKQLYNTDRCISSSSFIFYKVVSPKSHFQWKRQID